MIKFTQQRLVLVICILASFVAFLDGSIVNVALPAIMRDLGGGLSLQQWVVDAYLVTLGSLMLIAGSLSDLFGRKRVLWFGLLGFLITSLLCAVAPTGVILVVARALQGVAGALLVPSSLALIISTFSGREQGKAIGAWTAWTGVAFVVGPLLGGFLVDTASWRWTFAINVLPICVTLWLMQKLTKADPTERVPLDVVGALLCFLGLGGPVYALIEHTVYGWSNPYIYMPLVLGVLFSIYFIWHEHKTKHPMLPLSLFSIRNFTVGNVATTFIYAGLAVSSFLITVFIQQAEGYSAFAAGMALLPITIVMLLLSSRFGALSGKIGPRIFMTLGPITSGTGMLLLLLVAEPLHYWTQLFPGVTLFSIGLAATVAPLTSAVLGSIDARRAGIASAVNNAISRVAGLAAIAALGLITGPHIDLHGFHRGTIAIAVLLVLGGVVSAFGIRNLPAKTENGTGEIALP